MNLRVERAVGLRPEQAAQVRRLIEASPGATDNPPLSEQAVLRLESGDHVHHVLAFDSDDEQAVGYAQLQSDSRAVELVTVSGPRAVPVAAALVGSARQATSAGPISLWAHGRLSAAEAFAQAESWHPTRELLQLRRQLGDAVGPAGVIESAGPVGSASAVGSAGAAVSGPPAGGAITIRAFQPGVDDAAWLELNALAFSHHPEQGYWTAADLADRLSSSWFDPAGFFLAERAGRLVGFHWTKVHHELSPEVGEVYVLGVHPSAQGQRLGQLLLDTGLEHLRRQGLRSVLLYVEGDNTPAVRLYEKEGFATFSVDIQYSPPTH